MKLPQDTLFQKVLALKGKEYLVSEQINIIVLVVLQMPEAYRGTVTFATGMECLFCGLQDSRF